MLHETARHPINCTPSSAQRGACIFLSHIKKYCIHEHASMGDGRLVWEDVATLLKRLADGLEQHLWGHNSTAPKNAPSNALFQEFGCRDLVAVTGSSAATRLAAFFHRCLASCCLPPFVTAATLRVGVGLGAEIVLGASTSCSSGAMCSVVGSPPARSSSSAALVSGSISRSMSFFLHV